MWLIDKCCFCVDLRTASLLLASLGAFSNLYTACLLLTMPTAHHGPNPKGDYETIYESPYKLMALYSLLAGFACLMAIRGVIRSDHKQLRLFALINWFEFGCSVMLIAAFSLMAFTVDIDKACSQVADRPDVHLDSLECKRMYTGMATWASMFMAAGLLVKLHYCLAVHSYYVRLLCDAQFVDIVHAAPYGYTEISAAPPLYDESVSPGQMHADLKISTAGAQPPNY